MDVIVSLKKANNLSTLKFIFFSIVTLDIYELVWIYQTNQSINKRLGVKVKSQSYIILLSVLVTISFLDNVLSLLELNNPFEKFNNIIDIIKYLMFVEWSNYARYVLTYYCLGEYNLNVKTKSFYMILFNIYYINYLINFLGDTKHINKESPFSKNNKLI